MRRADAPRERETKAAEGIITPCLQARPHRSSRLDLIDRDPGPVSPRPALRLVDLGCLVSDRSPSFYTRMDRSNMIPHLTRRSTRRLQRRSLRGPEF